MQKIWICGAAGQLGVAINEVVDKLEYEILNLTGKNAKIKAVPTEQSDFSAVRPNNAALNNFVLSLSGEFVFPEWRESLKKYLTEMGFINESENRINNSDTLGAFARSCRGSACTSVLSMHYCISNHGSSFCC